MYQNRRFVCCWHFLEPNLCGNPLIRCDKQNCNLAPASIKPATIPTTPTRAATRIKIPTLRDTLNFEAIFFSYPQNILFWSSDNILFDALKCLGVFYKICTCDFVFCKTSNIFILFFFHPWGGFFKLSTPLQGKQSF